MEKEKHNNEEAAKYQLHYFHRKDIPELTAGELEQESELIYARLMQQQANLPKVRSMWIPAAAAAAVLLIAGLAFFYFSQSKVTAPAENQLVKVSDAEPGKHSATLMLANGKAILLSAIKEGKVAEQSGVTISKTKENVLVYSANTDMSNPSEYNTIATAKGQEYSIVLPDGSKIWLNAASSVKYPATFASVKERIVELNGEAYFEIAKDKAHPFIVKTKGQQIKVLGTHFNVNSYADEKTTKTTLLEGSVQIKGVNDVLLKPGQQAVSTENGLKVSKANLTESVAWKNGDFIFEEESLPSILRQVSRWYDVEIVDPGNHDNLHLSGAISRSRKLSTVLKVLAGTSNLKFSIQGNKVFVTK